MSDKPHPVFARIYERLSPGWEKDGQAELRARTLARLSGRVVEVGAGNGLNFGHYPAAVTEVVAVEPEPYLRERAAERAAEAPVPVSVVAGDADALPLADGEADAVVTSLVLCSVPDQASALAEARRVLKPGGELRFYEHVVSHKRGKAAFQRAFTKTVWKRVSGGCHMDRDTGRAIADAGFEITELDRVPFHGLAHILGVAHVADGYAPGMETSEQGHGDTEESGSPESNPQGPGDQRGGEESDTSGAPDTSSPNESDSGQATGNPGAAG